MEILSFILAGAPAGRGNSQGGWWIIVLEFVLIFWVFYIFVIRPQTKEKTRLQQMRESIKKGDRVITAGGIHAIVARVNKDKKTVTLQVGDKLSIDVSESAVATVVNTTSKK